MKKIIIMLLLLCSSAYGDDTKKTIYIIQTVSHPALDNSYQGLIDKLSLNGFVNGKTIDIKFSNAHGDSVIANQIAKKFSSKTPDVIVAIATSAAQSVANATRNTNIPVVFSSVTDPIEAGLIKNLKAPNSNITGVSNFVELDSQLLLFKEILPNLNKLGFIYNPGEINSVKLLQTLQEKAKIYNIQIITAVASKTTEVSGATNKLIDKVDAIFISNDNTALAAFSVITKISLSAKTPVFVSDTDMVKNGALAALGPNQYKIGQQTGEMVTAILRGIKVKDLPVEFPLKVELVLNQKIAKELGIEFTNKLLDRAKL